MSCCLSLYFLLVFNTLLRGLWMFGFVGLKIIFWVLFVELRDLLTPLVTRWSLAMSHLGETLLTSFLSCQAQVMSSSLSILLFPSALGLSTFGYTAILRRTCNFLIIVLSKISICPKYSCQYQAVTQTDINFL